MSVWKPHRTPDDPPKDPEILRWFAALGPPPSGLAPPDLYAKVHARIVQQQAQWRIRTWLPQVNAPRLATALAMALVLSLGLNIWWGLHALRPSPPGTHQEVQASREPFSTAGQVPIYRFQASLSQAKTLGVFVATHVPVREPSTLMTFTPHAARTTFFQLGTLFADALITLSGSAMEAAAQRLDMLVRVLSRVQAPAPLPQYLRAIQALLHSQQYTGEEVAAFLALFEPLYTDAYAGTDSQEQLLLFRAGTWVENLYLAAVAGDPTALQQGGQAVEEVRRGLATLYVPPQVLAGMERLYPLVTRQRLTEEDIRVIRTLVQDIQREFGE
jgi:hypothetical protein